MRTNFDVSKPFHLISQKFVCCGLLLVTLCDLWPVKSNLSKEVSGINLKISHNEAGFHRIMCYDAEIKRVTGKSKLLISEVLPKEMYIDSYQVQHMAGVILKEFVDSEAPSYLSKTVDVQLCSLSENNIHQICIPIHLRYQHPHECHLYGKTTYFTLNTSSDFLQIKVGELKNFPANNSDKLLECSENGETKNYLVNIDHVEVIPQRFEIPVGCNEHFYYVLILTVFTVGLSTIYLSFVFTKISYELFS